MSHKTVLKSSRKNQRIGRKHIGVSESIGSRVRKRG